MPRPRGTPFSLRASARSASSGLLLTLLGCATRHVPDPALAIKAYATAVERGDAEAVYAILTPRAQRSLGLEGTRQLLRASRAELVQNARLASGPERRIQTSAEARFRDGESATLVFENGGFVVDAASVLPARPRTPSEALGALRHALARRSYPALSTLMAEATRSSMEADLASLVSGLEHPETLDIRQNGEEAEVRVPHGHLIRLKRESGVWRVVDFD